MFGFSFSWRRAIGLSAAKARLSRRIGIPLTQAGRERKIGRAVMGSGVAVPLLLGGGSGIVGCLGTIVKLAVVVALLYAGFRVYRSVSAGHPNVPAAAPAGAPAPEKPTEKPPHEPTFDEILKQHVK